MCDCDETGMLGRGAQQHHQPTFPSPPGNPELEEGKKKDDTLAHQLERKYLCQDEQEVASRSEQFILDIFGSSPCKAAHEKLLELLVLDNLSIRRIGSLERFGSLVSKVAELDLNSNHLDWFAVGQLFQSFPQLRTLNISHNRALGAQRLVGGTLPPAPKLNNLIMNGLRLSFSTIGILLQNCPALRELHLSKCRFSDVGQLTDDSDPSARSISTLLTELHLNDCALEHWCQVLSVLQLFPCLQSLFLADNGLSSVQRECECGLDTAQLTGRMRALSLSNTNIGHWESLDNLEAMGRLEELRILQIPLLQKYSVEERRHLVIARVRSLKMLNGSAVSGRQREESERFFIRHYAQAEKKPLIYERLVAEHGMLEQLVDVDLTPKRTANVLIRCDETDWQNMWVRLRLSGTVQELMKFAEQITKIPLRVMRIFYLDKNISLLGPTELRFPNQQLKMLHIEDGDEFFVQSKLVWTQRKGELEQTGQ